MTAWVLVIMIAGRSPIYFADKASCEKAKEWYKQSFVGAECFPGAYIPNEVRYEQQR